MASRRPTAESQFANYFPPTSSFRQSRPSIFDQPPSASTYPAHPLFTASSSTFQAPPTPAPQFATNPDAAWEIHDLLAETYRTSKALIQDAVGLEGVTPSRQLQLALRQYLETLQTVQRQREQETAPRTPASAADELDLPMGVTDEIRQVLQDLGLGSVLSNLGGFSEYGITTPRILRALLNLASQLNPRDTVVVNRRRYQLLPAGTEEMLADGIRRLGLSGTHLSNADLFRVLRTYGQPLWTDQVTPEVRRALDQDLQHVLSSYVDASAK